MYSFIREADANRRLYKMATAILFTFFLCLFVCAVFSTPVAYDSKSMQSSHNVRDTEIIENSDFDTETALTPDVNSGRDINLVQSLHSVSPHDEEVVPNLTASLRSGRRIKRQVIMGHGCADGWIWFLNRCMSFEKYERLVQEEEMDK